jgi:hypothetical protein
MRLSSLLRLSTALCGTLFLCLFSVAVADAAPSHTRRVVSHRTCGARTATCRVKARAPKQARQPAAYFVRAKSELRDWIYQLISQGVLKQESVYSLGGLSMRLSTPFPRRKRPTSRLSIFTG